MRVLLVSAGASPDALVAELERLGVEITPCSFADAEEHLETDPPDLVALAGALGAIELANMLDDLEDAPRMVIVAERKELAKLRGLNREVVVSLFAMETTEKVVGQRIESLARRAARRRDHKAAEPAPVNKTSLGLPSAAHVGKLELKKGEPPPRSRGPAMREQVPPSSGKHPGAEPEPEPARIEPAAEPELAALPEAIPQALEGAGPPPEPSRAKAPIAKEDKGVLPKAAVKPPLPERRLPTRSAKEEAEQSIMVIDEDLLESILPDPPEGTIPEISLLSMISIIPDPEDAPVSHPPTLPPAAKAQASRLPDLRLSASPGELDIGDAESALENLDSVKLEITQELVEHAQREMGSSQPVPGENEESRGNEETAPAEGAVAAKLLATFEDEAAFLEETAVMPHPAPSLKETSDTEEKDVPAFKEASGVKRPIGEAAQKKGGGGKAFALLALVGVVLGGVYVASSGKLAGEAGPVEKAATQTLSTASEKEAPTDDAAVIGPPREPQKDELADAPAEGSEIKSTLPADEEPLPEDGPEAPATMATSSLDNPFKRQDAKAPSCEALLGSAVPARGPDPVSEASAAWDKARAAIVGGKLEVAHQHMCEAVSINPDSAALEGLAAHYLSLGSYSEALRWANKADSVRPGQTDIGNLMGDVYAMMGDVQKARDTWVKLLNIGPDESSRLGPISKDYSVEAGRHLRRGDLVRAEIFFRRAVILDPENQSGLIGLAKVYHRLEMPAYARAFCDMSLKLSDVIPEVHVLLGELSLAEGNTEEARQRFERALAVRPDFFPAKRGLSQVK